MRKVISFILVVSILAAFLCGCAAKSDEVLIQERMETFIKAYNSGDMEAVLACLDAKTRNTYQAALNIGSAMIGITGFEIDVEDLFGLGVGLMSEGDILQLSDVGVSMISDRKATVHATMHYHDLEKSYSQTVYFTMVKEDSDWYILG